MQRSIWKARSRHGTAVGQSNVGTSNHNGRIERCIHDSKGLVRALRPVIEEQLGVNIHLADPVVPWQVGHAAHTTTSSRVREGGRAACQLMRGRRSNARLVPSCGAALFKTPETQHAIGDFENRGAIRRGRVHHEVWWASGGHRRWCIPRQHGDAEITWQTMVC